MHLDLQTFFFRLVLPNYVCPTFKVFKNFLSEQLSFELLIFLKVTEDRDKYIGVSDPVLTTRAY